MKFFYYLFLFSIFSQPMYSMEHDYSPLSCTIEMAIFNIYKTDLDDFAKRKQASLNKKPFAWPKYSTKCNYLDLLFDDNYQDIEAQQNILDSFAKIFPDTPVIVGQKRKRQESAVVKTTKKQKTTNIDSKNINSENLQVHQKIMHLYKTTMDIFDNNNLILTKFFKPEATSIDNSTITAIQPITNLTYNTNLSRLLRLTVWYTGAIETQTKIKQLFCSKFPLLSERLRGMKSVKKLPKVFIPMHAYQLAHEQTYESIIDCYNIKTANFNASMQKITNRFEASPATPYSLLPFIYSPPDILRLASKKLWHYANKVNGGIFALETINNILTTLSKKQSTTEREK